MDPATTKKWKIEYTHPTLVYVLWPLQKPKPLTILPYPMGCFAPGSWMI